MIDSTMYFKTNEASLRRLIWIAGSAHKTSDDMATFWENMTTREVLALLRLPEGTWVPEHDPVDWLEGMGRTGFLALVETPLTSHWGYGVTPIAAVEDAHKKCKGENNAT